MARSYRIKIDEIFLTRSGNQVDNDPCELDVSNVEDLQTNFRGLSQIAIDGTRIVQIFDPEEVEFEIKITKLYRDVYESLKTAANANLLLQTNGEDANFPLEGDGDLGDFAISAIWNIEKPFRAERGENGKVYGIILRFIRKIES